MSKVESGTIAESTLIATCKAKQGEFLPGDHGPGSWATTYSHDFVDAASRLYLLYKGRGHRRALRMLASIFRSNNIRSCRGAEMTSDLVDYLYKAHLARRISQLEGE